MIARPETIRAAIEALEESEQPIMDEYVAQPTTRPRWRAQKRRNLAILRGLLVCAMAAEARKTKGARV